MQDLSIQKIGQAMYEKKDAAPEEGEPRPDNSGREETK